MQVLKSSVWDSAAELHCLHSVSPSLAVTRGRKNPLRQGLALRLKQARGKLGISQRELAEAARVSQSLLSTIEGGGNTSIDLVERLALAIRLSPIYLAFGDEGALPFRQKRHEWEIARSPANPKLDRSPCPPYRFCTAGDRIFQARASLGRSQASLAQEAGLSHTALGNIEAQKNVPKLNTIELIAFVIRVSPGWLAFGDDPA